MSRYTDKKAIFAFGIALLLCCVGGCAGEGMFFWSKPAAQQTSMICDPFYGFHSTCWHAWPFCGAQPTSVAPINAQDATGNGWPEPKPGDRGPELLPAPRAEQQPPLTAPAPVVPAPPQPGRDNAVPTLPDNGASSEFKSTYFDRPNEQDGWPMDELNASRAPEACYRR